MLNEAVLQSNSVVHEDITAGGGLSTVFEQSREQSRSRSVITEREPAPQTQAVRFCARRFFHIYTAMQARWDYFPAVGDPGGGTCTKNPGRAQELTAVFSQLYRLASTKGLPPCGR